ncbi:hypothetical protein B484DRAFT_225636 [Ochromonadaceae sp. CCMP2298]|nr:hypothetical protein B484DRAFT_225636 [Ochromonadaceae sp. CCMP2298]
MAAMASSADVPTVVYHKGLEKFGICLEKQKQVYKFLHPYSDSYLNGIYMAPKKEVTDTHLSYFMSYQSVINREPDGFILTDNSTLIPTTVERMSCATQALSAFDPVPAKYQDEVGIIFPNTASLVDHFFAGLCDVLDPDYCIPDNIADDQVAFLAFRPLLKAAVGEDPLRLLPRSEVQIFRLDAGNEVNDKQLNQSVLKSNKKGKKAAPNSVSFKQAPTVLANTPAVPFALGKRVSRSGGSSEGNTTIASSSECDQDQADNSLLTSSNYSILNRSAASSSPAHTAGSSDDEAELRAQGGVKSEAGQDAPHAHLRIPGPSDVLNAEMVHATAPRETADQIALRKEEIRAIIDRNWDFMKTGLQWGKFHVRPGQKSASLLELFVVPLPRQHCTVLKDLQLIENLEYFHEKESFLKHCKENPCLVEDWKYLWPRLKAAGWEHVKPQEEKGGESARPFFYPPFVARYFLEGDGEKSVECLRKRGLVPGTHLFVSRVSVSRFIARFPHLLQTDEQLVVTLRRYGWEVEETAGKGAKALWVYLEQDSSWRKSKKATEWVGLEELRRRLWMTPTRLFQHLADFTKQGAVGKVDVYGSGAKVQPLCQALLLQAVCLLEDDALAEETEDNSPTVQGLSQKSMEEAVKAVTNYTQGSDKVPPYPTTSPYHLIHYHLPPTTYHLPHHTTTTHNFPPYHTYPPHPLTPTPRRTVRSALCCSS